MQTYTKEELIDALRCIDSIIHKCEKALEKFVPGKSQYTLLKNRLKAMYISKDLLENQLQKKQVAGVNPLSPEHVFSPELLLKNLDKLHTTVLGANRIQKNLDLQNTDVVSWCRERIQDKNAAILRNGKNWYVVIDNCKITINAHSNTIITAHKEKSIL